MKVGGSKKKKAVSAVVATILIVMITVLAIGIIWVTILPMIQENLAVSDVCENAGVSIISSQGYTCYKPSNITMVQVSKGKSEVNVTGLTFSISSSGNSYDYDEQEVAYSTMDYNVYYLNTSEFEKIEKISVVPVIKFGDSEKSCSAISLEDIPLCSASVNLVEASSGRLIGRSSSYSATVPIVPPACIPNCSCAANIPKGETCLDSNCDTLCEGEKMIDSNGNGYLEIYTWVDLNNVRNNLTASYELMNNLDEDSIGYGVYAGPSANGGAGWEPIGYDNSHEENGEWIEEPFPFAGVFNGDNYNISDLFINRSSQDYLGLFGYAEGNFSNIGLVNFNLIGASAVGGLVGFSWKGCNINNSFFIGNVSGSASLGGLAGILLKGSIGNSYSISNVSGSGDGVGGLLGATMGAKIVNSYSISNVIGSYNVGGLVGIASGIINSYSLGTVNGFYDVGGLVGRGTIVSDSYSMSNVSGDLYAGGLAGEAVKINNSYSIGYVVGGDYSGALVGGLSQTPVTVINSFWNKNTSGMVTSIRGVGKTIDEMKNISTFSTWDSTNVWNLTQDNYPKLKWQN